MDFGFVPFFRVLTGRCLNRRISARVRTGVSWWEPASLFVAGSVDDRQVLLRVVIPFGALAWAYKYLSPSPSPSKAGVWPRLRRPTCQLRTVRLEPS